MSSTITRLATILSALSLALLGLRFAFKAVAGLSDPTGFTTFAAIAAPVYLVCASVFAVPTLRRAILRQTSRSGTRGLIAFLATLVLFLILFPAVMLIGSRTGLALCLGFALLYTLAFILPGLAYRPYRQTAAPPDQPLVEHPVRPKDIARYRPLALIALPLFFLGMIQAIAGMLFIAATPSPEWRAAGWFWLPLTTALLFLPILPAILIRRYSGGSGGIDSPLGQRIVLLLGGLGVSILFAWQFQTKTLVWGWNKITGAAVGMQTFVVAKAEPRSGLRGCHARIIAFAKDRPEATFDLCNYPRTFVETLSPGDVLSATARTSYFGLSEIGLRVADPEIRFKPDARP